VFRMDSTRRTADSHEPIARQKTNVVSERNASFRGTEDAVQEAGWDEQRLFARRCAASEGLCKGGERSRHADAGRAARQSRVDRSVGRRLTAQPHQADQLLQWG